MGNRQPVPPVMLINLPKALALLVDLLPVVLLIRHTVGQVQQDRTLTIIDLETDRDLVLMTSGGHWKKGRDLIDQMQEGYYN